MVTYNLNENPDVFISPDYYDNEFVYEMALIKGKENRERIHTIDLRNDDLMIYGTQVKESMFKKLHESLVIRPKGGLVFVNCIGAYYVYVEGKVKPIHNVMFDWSSFGVIVPNSVHDSLRKQLEKQEKAVEKSNQQCELAKIEVESTKASLKASHDEVNELKKVQNDMGLKMQKAYEKVALIDFELELYKIELESCKKELDEVLDELCSCKGERAKMEMELQEMHDRFSSEISSFNEKNCDMNMKSKMLENELSLESSDKNVKQHKERLLSFEHIFGGIMEELKKVQDQFFKADKEVQNTMSLLESSRKEVEESKDQIRCYKKEHQCMEVQMQKMINHIRLINLEVKSSNQKLDQLLISSLWKELNHSNRKVSIPCTNCGHTIGIPPPTLEIIANEVQIH